ncbi:polysaccharide lyase 6 family protein [Candidatus Latescibacterota bacterium]
MANSTSFEKAGAMNVIKIYSESICYRSNRWLSYAYIQVILIIVAVVMISTGCDSEPTSKHITINVSTAEELREAVDRVLPGTIIIAGNGDYAFDDSPLRVSVRATEDAPVVIRAENIGMSKFTGEYAVLLDSCAHVTFDGFALHNRALKHALSYVTPTDIWIEAMRDELPHHGSFLVLNSNNCRLTGLTFKLEEQEGFTEKMLLDRLPRMHWLNLSGGQYNRVDHCHFSGKVNSGVYIEIGPLEQHFRIDRNHFDGRPPGNYNGFETIRACSGGLNNMYGLIDYNLFENCDGEGEIISVKSSVLRISHNTFRDCAGMLTIRMGGHVTVDYNYFLNPSGKKGVGGVRVHGSDNNIINNYFSDLTGLGLMSYWGDFDKPHFIHDEGDSFRYDLSSEAFTYRQANRVYLAFNTWVNCASFLNLGAYRKYEIAELNLPPNDWSLLNNIVICNDTQFIHGEGETGFRWMGNIFWNPSGDVNIGRILDTPRITVVDPKLECSEDGIWRLSKDSPAVDNGRAWYYPAEIIPGFMEDIDGQPRDLAVKVTEPQVQSEFKFDAGADEYSDAPVKNRPLTGDDVGPASR